MITLALTIKGKRLLRHTAVVRTESDKGGQVLSKGQPPLSWTARALMSISCLHASLHTLIWAPHCLQCQALRCEALTGDAPFNRDHSRQAWLHGRSSMSSRPCSCAASTHQSSLPVPLQPRPTGICMDCGALELFSGFSSPRTALVEGASQSPTPLHACPTVTPGTGTAGQREGLLQTGPGGMPNTSQREATGPEE